MKDLLWSVEIFNGSSMPNTYPHDAGKWIVTVKRRSKRSDVYQDGPTEEFTDLYVAARFAEETMENEEADRASRKQ